MIEQLINTQNISDLEHLLDVQIALKIPGKESIFTKDNVVETLSKYRNIIVNDVSYYLSYYLVYFDYNDQNYIAKLKTNHDLIRSIYVEKLRTNSRRIRLDISYDGSQYSGSQRQLNASTVQETLEGCLNNLLKDSIQLQSASRTDKGVHALHQVIHFDTVNPLPTHKIKSLLNTMLDEAIYVIKAEDVPQVFHARYDVVDKTYVYKISHIKDPFKSKYTYYHKMIDLNTLNENISVFQGKHDFRSFSKAVNVEDTTRTIKSIKAYYASGQTIIEICGDGFLRNMIRMMIGQVIYDIDFGKNTVKEALNHPDDLSMKHVAKAEGLYLKTINYEKR
ncbi:tRNA pseudouridine(38-40) synthase TruA [Liberiplasma polymorphum]|uniref:tRNA pseudouridine(38-40) synthase TruA n=1 Tax=Liberiplasma polymorphum TaxID=3374570 RepID=UPI0037748344